MSDETRILRSKELKRGLGWAPYQPPPAKQHFRSRARMAKADIRDTAPATPRSAAAPQTFDDQNPATYRGVGRRRQPVEARTESAVQTINRVAVDLLNSGRALGGDTSNLQRWLEEYLDANFELQLQLGSELVRQALAVISRKHMERHRVTP